MKNLAIWYMTMISMAFVVYFCDISLDVLASAIALFGLFGGFLSIIVYNKPIIAQFFVHIMIVGFAVAFAFSLNTYSFIVAISPENIMLFIAGIIFYIFSVDRLGRVLSSESKCTMKL